MFFFFKILAPGGAGAGYSVNILGELKSISLSTTTMAKVSEWFQI